MRPFLRITRTRITIACIIGLGLIGLGLGLIYFIFFSRFMQIDTCLDRGGAWDYKHNMCSSECEQQAGSWDAAKKTCAFN